MTVENPRDLLGATFDDLEEFLKRGIHETEVLDYKADFGDDLAGTVAAMANTDGGTIIVGVDEDRRTKAPTAWRGISNRDARGTFTTHLTAYLDPNPRVETGVIDAPDERVFLIAVVHASTRRVVLHREHGLRVRVGDQSVAPNRSAFERLLAREMAATSDAESRRVSVAGRAGLWSGPGDGSGNVYLTVATEPLADVILPPSERLDDLLQATAHLLFGASFATVAEVDRSAAERTRGADTEHDRVSISRAGQVDVRLLVHGFALGSPGHPEWMIGATQLAVEAIRCSLFPFALARAEPSLRLTVPAAGAVSISGWDGHRLHFGYADSLRKPDSMGHLRLPVMASTLVEPADAFAIARDTVRQLARFYGQRGADAWAESFGSQIKGVALLREWMPELLG